MKSYFVFFISILACIVILALERVAGIEWDFHPDAVTYTTTYELVVAQGINAMPNQLYYFISAIMMGNVPALISLNILAYCLTNVILAKAYTAFYYQGNTKSPRFLLLLLLFLASPYRLHLAVHVLKDTFVILTLCIFVAYKGRKITAWLALLPLFLLRIYAALYMVLILRGRYWLLSILFGMVIIIFTDLIPLDLLLDHNEKSMRVREFDTIPDFYEWGVTGIFIRMIVWPVLMVTGTFAIISPALLFIPVALDVLLARIWSRQVFGHFGLTLGLMVCLSLFAACVNSFTAYVRYVYPALTVIPLLIMQNKVLISSSKTKKI